jgi:ribonuclease Y
MILLAVLATLSVGVVAGYFGSTSGLARKGKSAKEEAARALTEAEESNRRLLFEAREEALRIRATADGEIQEHRQELLRLERRLHGREENLEGRANNLEKREAVLGEREQSVQSLQVEIEELKERQQLQLENLASLTSQEAREMILHTVEAQMEYDLARRAREMEQRAKEEADEKARRYITLAIHRLASDVVSEHSVTTVPIPNDEMKGRLIGREGRNIRALEAATGVDLVIDDTPEAVSISCFDPLRREVARLALTRLVQDGRIHPARIEEAVEKSKIELEETLWREGQQATLDAGVRGLNPEIIKLLGRLKFRYSYGENVLRHAVEVSLLSGMLAAEVGADIQIAKAGGLLHDIGKALTHEVEGPHAEIGAEIASRYGISEPIRRAVEEHHDDEMGSVEAFLVSSADAISAARPGARRDTLEHYIQRLEALEGVAKNFPGVEKVFAIQAGREIRIMVQPETVDDVAASKLCRDIVKRIEETLTYPGQIKVMVVRETRTTEFAR